MMRRPTRGAGELPAKSSILNNVHQLRVGETRFLSPRLPSEMQWLKSNQVLGRSAFDAIHFGKAANSRACGGDPMSERRATTRYARFV
jgi:hypothetical protein